MGNFIDVGGLRERQDKHGQVVFSGKLDQNVPAGAKLWISPNTRRENDKQPGHRITLITDDVSSSESPAQVGRWPNDKPIPRPVAARPRQFKMNVPAGRRGSRKEFAGEGTDMNDEMPF